MAVGECALMAAASALVDGSINGHKWIADRALLNEEKVANRDDDDLDAAVVVVLVAVAEWMTNP
jgi:hypothetical protein